MTLREILDERKKSATPLKYGPRKNRPWGQLQKRRFREEHGSVEPGPQYGVMLHYKNAAARRKYRAGLDAIMATGAEGDALQLAIEDLQNHYCKRVTIYEGLNAKVRHDLRSLMRKEDRAYAAEHDSRDF